MLSRRIPVIIGLVVLILAGSQAIRIARSDYSYRSATLESVWKAIRLDPGRARNRLGLATLLDGAGEDPRPALREAAALTPDDGSIWIRLGLQEEIHGRMEAAEASLLEAARVSRKFEARWSLANFYYRRDRPEQFWPWAREAFEFSHGDRTPLFSLCWSVAPSPDVILERAVPDRREVHIAWVYFLFGRQQFAAAADVVRDLMRGMVSDEKGFFLRATNVFLAQGMFSSAIEVWNALCGQGWIDRQPLDPAKGAILTNGSFLNPTLNQGFDWRVARTEGVFVAQTPGGWRISLTGNQPEKCEILSQSVPLAGGRGYRIRSRYRSASVALAFPNPDSGVRWSFRTSGGLILAESEPLATEGEGEAGLVFTAPADVSGGRLVLRYERGSGAVRTESTIIIDEVWSTAD